MSNNNGRPFLRSSAASQPKNPRTLFTLIGCGLFTIAAGCLPYVISKRMKPLNSREETLNAAAIRRGAFTNSGSKDAGLDKDWDFNTNRYRYIREENVKTIGKSRFDDILSPLGGQSNSMTKADKKQ